MSLNEVYDFLYDWIHYVLNTRFNEGIQIIIGSQNNPKPAKKYLVINEPPMSNIKVGDTQKITTYVDDDDVSYLRYSNTWRCGINIDEVGSTGSYIQKLLNSLEEDAVKDLFRNAGDISLESISAGSANNDLLGNYIEKRYNMEVFLLYTEETTIESEIIESVEISERTYIRGGG